MGMPWATPGGGIRGQGQKKPRSRAQAYYRRTPCVGFPMAVIFLKEYPPRTGENF
jgi:hypothetical protein